MIEKHLAKNTKLYIAFIDFRKAYDRIDRNVLWSVLMKNGVQGKMFCMLRSIYKSVQANVLCERGETGFFECMQGLKQGCVLSPILFSLLINELANEIVTNGKHGVSLSADTIELFLLLFADDLTLLSSTIVGLQNQLNVLNSVIKQLSLTVNLDKSKIIVFRKGGFLASKERWVLDGKEVEVVNSYKYLGLLFSTRLSFKLAIEDAAIRAKKSTIDILRTMNRIGCNSPEIFFKLFDTQVVPILLYASEIWGYKKYNEIEKVHLFACKRFMHVITATPNDAVYGELGRYPLWITSAIRCVSYWCKLLIQPENYYSKKAYKMSLNMQDKGYITWATHVKTLLYENGLQQVWLFGCGNVKHMCKILRERLYSSFCYNWQSHLDSSQRLSTYRNYKDRFEREQYIDILWLDCYRNSLAQFRMGVSQINEHRFRYSRNIEDTKCPFGCNQSESEVHFLFECKSYDQ